jgi:hypothetical protein
MPKQFFKLTGYYDGLTVKRIAQSGRLWLVRVVNDPPPYWFVMIKGFDPTRDRASGTKSMGVWRFVDESDALAKFNKLRPLYPPQVVKPPTDKQLAARARFKELRAMDLLAGSPC